MKILEKNICNLQCKCGWNIVIGGTKAEELLLLEYFVKGHHKNLLEITLFALKKEIITTSRAAELLGVKIVDIRKLRKTV